MVSTVFEDLKYWWNKANIAKEADTLCSSIATLEEFPFAGITVMVPREADIDCAQVSRTTAAAILTNDSDLLLYDLGQRGSVLLLDSVEMSKWNPYNPMDAEIRALRLCPTIIARQLGIPSVRCLAYELKCNPEVRLPDLVRRSKSTAECNAMSDYYLFVKDYDPGLGSSIDVYKPKLQFPQYLDPRVSEVFSQYVYEDFYPCDGALHMYLPILNDDHARRSAWELGRTHRRLGYSAFNLSHPAMKRYGYIHEYVRRGQRIAVDSLPLDNEEQGTLGMRFLSEHLSLAQAVFNYDYKSPSYWRMFAMGEIICAGTNNAKLPTPELLTRFFKLGYMGSKPELADVHLLAQTQAVLYSLRVLKQFLETTNQTEHFARSVKSVLAGLPPLHVLMRSRHEITREFPDEASIDYFVHALLQFCERRSLAEASPNKEEAGQCIDQEETNSYEEAALHQTQEQRLTVDRSAQGRGFNLYELLALP